MRVKEMVVGGLVSTNSSMTDPTGSFISTVGFGLRGRWSERYHGVVLDVEVDLRFAQLDIMNENWKGNNSRGAGMFKPPISEEERFQSTEGRSEPGNVVVQLEGPLATRVLRSEWSNAVASCWTCGSANSLQEG